MEYKLHNIDIRENTKFWRLYLRRIVFLCIITALVIMGCAKASDPTDTTEGVLNEVTRIPLNGDAIGIDYSDSYIAVAEYDAGLSIIDRNTFERTWHTQIVGNEGSVLNLGRNRRINLVEDLGFLLFTEEQGADSYRIVDVNKIDTLQILGSVTGGTYAIRQIELFPYDDPEPNELFNYTAKGFFVNGYEISVVAWNSVDSQIYKLEEESWTYPARTYGAARTEEYMFAACNQRGIFVSDRFSYENLTEFDTPGEALRIKVQGNYAYVATRQTGLNVYDVSDIYNPVEVYNYDTTGYAQNLDVNEDYCVVASGGGNLYVYDISDPTNIRFIERETSTGYTNNVKIDDNNRVYVATRDEGVVIFDIER